METKPSIQFQKLRWENVFRRGLHACSVWSRCYEYAVGARGVATLQALATRCSVVRGGVGMALLTRSISSAMLAAGVAVATISSAHESPPLPSAQLLAQTSRQAVVPAATQPRQLNLEHRQFTGDFDAMVERRMIR